MSARQIALRNGMHPRVLLQHFKNHRNGLVGSIRSGRRGAAVLQRLQASVSVLTEAKSLYNRTLGLLERSLASDSQREARGWIGEARECLKLLGQASGELTAGQNVTVAVGVSVERAREAVAVVDEAASLTDSELADRAMRMLEAYNMANPNDMRIVGLPAGRLVEPDGPPA